MKSNSEQFAFFTFRVFNELNDSFPIPVFISIERLIYDFNETAEKLYELEYRVSVALDQKKLLVELNAYDNTPVSTELQMTETELESLNQLVLKIKDEQKGQKKVLEGTLLFLENEGYIGKVEKNKYLLTEKGFTQLKEQFKDTKFVELNNRSFISIIEDLNKNPDNFWKSVTNGVVVNVLSYFLGL